MNFKHSFTKTLFIICGLKKLMFFEKTGFIKNVSFSLSVENLDMNKLIHIFLTKILHLCLYRFLSHINRFLIKIFWKKNLSLETISRKKNIIHSILNFLYRKNWFFFRLNFIVLCVIILSRNQLIVSCFDHRIINYQIRNSIFFIFSL